MARTDRRLLWGFVFLGAGLAILLINLGLLPISWFALWPLALSLLGLWLLLEAARRPGRRGLVAGLLALAIGAFWMAEQQGWVRQNLFPAVLFLALGLGLLMRGLGYRRG
ncbi:MAG: hypothetical protein AB1449_04800 [Chloroflexota bacterium]